MSALLLGGHLVGDHLVSLELEASSRSRWNWFGQFGRHLRNKSPGRVTSEFVDRNDDCFDVFAYGC